MLNRGRESVTVLLGPNGAFDTLSAGQRSIPQRPYLERHLSNETEQINERAVRRLYESFASGDIEGIRAIVSSDIEFHMPGGFADGGTFYGFDEIVDNVFARQRKDWENVSVVPARYITDGDAVVALFEWSGTASETGKSVVFEGAHVFDFEDGTIARWRAYADTAMFNAALEV